MKSFGGAFIFTHAEEAGFDFGKGFIPFHGLGEREFPLAQEDAEVGTPGIVGNVMSGVGIPLRRV